MLEKLALKHNTWVKMARSICKDNYLADDLVSEMYIKLAEYNKDLNDYYIFFTIKHIFINWIREEKKMNQTELHDNIVYEESLEKMEIPDCVSWVEKQILLLRQEKTHREIGETYKIHYTKIYRIEKEAKEKINQWVKEKYKELEMS